VSHNVLPRNLPTKHPLSYNRLPKMEVGALHTRRPGDQGLLTLTSSSLAFTRAPIDQIATFPRRPMLAMTEGDPL
jgi:hypothetical protein